MTRKSVPLLAGLAICLALVLAPGASAAPAPAAGGDLYVLQAAEGTLDGSKLVLRGVDPGVTSFTDRPVRSAGSLPVTRFARAWSGIFGSDPPNAALQVSGAPKGRDVAVLELRRPRYDAARHTLTYSVRRLKTTGDPALGSFDRRADGDAVKSFGRASLFVDDGGSPLVAVQLEAVLPPQADVTLTFDDAEVAFGSVEGNELGPQAFVLPPESGSSNSTVVAAVNSRSVEANALGGTSGAQVNITVYVTEPVSGKLTGKAALGGNAQAMIVAGPDGERHSLTNGGFTLPLGESG